MWARTTLRASRISTCRVGSGVDGGNAMRSALVLGSSPSIKRVPINCLPSSTTFLFVQYRFQSISTTASAGVRAREPQQLPLARSGLERRSAAAGVPTEGNKVQVLAALWYCWIPGQNFAAAAHKG
eukprot:TRINITY_DN17567_c0_g1_i2.p2 TRINITY_DN17567_c0_g1~~TRINITY_DN17567_c0_g1_i2.p2  ORF type:complete len:126 (+),score=7.90 TRINITY_DN17567_c0_g1_i2:539-916(+)